MRPREILNRLNGISTPIGGVSWNPPSLEIESARRVIAFLEDRRVLYNQSEVEMPDHCVQSVIEIRRHLTGELGRLDAMGELAPHLRVMRAACRKFLDGLPQRADRWSWRDPGHYAGWTFLTALGELRGSFGMQIAAVAAAYKLDIEEPLASILPAEDVE